MLRKPHRCCSANQYKYIVVCIWAYVWVCGGVWEISSIGSHYRVFVKQCESKSTMPAIWFVQRDTRLFVPCNYSAWSFYKYMTDANDKRLLSANQFVLIAAVLIILYVYTDILIVLMYIFATVKCIYNTHIHAFAPSTAHSTTFERRSDHKRARMKCALIISCN